MAVRRVLLCFAVLACAVYEVVSNDQPGINEKVPYFAMDGKFRDTVKICDYNVDRAITSSYLDAHEECVREYQPIVSKTSISYNLTGVINIHSWTKVKARMCTGWKLRTHSSQHWLKANSISYGKEQFIPTRDECISSPICVDCVEMKNYPQPCYNYWDSDICTSESTVVEVVEEETYVNGICAYRWKHSTNSNDEFMEGYWHFKAVDDCRIDPINFTVVVVPGTDIGVVLDNQATIDFSSPILVKDFEGFIMVGNKSLLTKESYDKINFTEWRSNKGVDYNQVYMSSVLNMTGDYLRYLDCRLTKVIQRMVESDQNFKDDLGSGQQVINKTKYTFPCASVSGKVYCNSTTKSLQVQTYLDTKMYFINRKAEITSNQSEASNTLRINSSHHLSCTNGDLYIQMSKRTTLYDEEGMMAYKPKVITSIDELNDWFSRLEANSKSLKKYNSSKEIEIISIQNTKNEGGSWFTLFNTSPMVWLAIGISGMSIVMSMCISMTTTSRLALMKEQIREVRLG